jgi:hypothetical protein
MSTLLVFFELISKLCGSNRFVLIQSRRKMCHILGVVKRFIFQEFSIDQDTENFAFEEAPPFFPPDKNSHQS